MPAEKKNSAGQKKVFLDFSLFIGGTQATRTTNDGTAEDDDEDESEDD